MTVGILGGGQLGLMLTESLRQLGSDVTVLEPDLDSPCAQRVAGVIQKALDDQRGLTELFSAASIATYDSENIPSAPLLPFAAKLMPSLKVLQVTQDRAAEKTFLAQNNFRPVSFSIIEVGENLHDAVERFGFPCIVKSARGGYDGKGQHRVRSRNDLHAIAQVSDVPWIIEEVLTLAMEISVIVARANSTTEHTFPVFENIHTDHILDLTVVPSRCSPSIRQEAEQVARSIARTLDVKGLLTVEFFVGSGREGQQRLYVNELAPRVHNSGHVTRRACTFSQFDALARILLDTPFSAPELLEGAWCMGNLLGDVWLAQKKTGGALNLSALAQFPDVVEVYLYGKREARPKRKMGHFIVKASTAEQAVKRAHAFRSALINTVN